MLEVQKAFIRSHTDVVSTLGDPVIMAIRPSLLLKHGLIERLRIEFRFRATFTP